MVERYWLLFGSEQPLLFVLTSLAGSLSCPLPSSASDDSSEAAPVFRRVISESFLASVCGKASLLQLVDAQVAAAPPAVGKDLERGRARPPAAHKGLALNVTCPALMS